MSGSSVEAMLHRNIDKPHPKDRPWDRQGILLHRNIEHALVLADWGAKTCSFLTIMLRRNTKN
jgi:hypothetical protein